MASSKFSVRLEGVKDVLTRLSAVERERVIQAITFTAGELLRDVIAPYPPPPKHPLAWASPQQRMAYIAMRRAAGLPLRYVRPADPMSQRLFQSWTVMPVDRHDALVSNRATYAYWVQSAEGQQPFHKKTGWITDVEAIKRLVASGDIERAAADIVRRAWAR